MEVKSKIAAVSIGAVTSLGLVGGLAALAGAQTRAPSAPAADSQPAADAQGAEENDPALNSSITAPQDESLSEADEATALEDLATITPAQAEQAAADTVGGTAGTAQLGNENGSVVYEVEVTDDAGMVHEVKVDAGNGSVLAQEAEGNEADEVNEGPEGPENAKDEMRAARTT
ncbi:MAG: PepSY domain-containing protein [Euzebya sp.]